MFCAPPTASAGARGRGPAMTVEIARAGRRDDRAPRTPAASVDRRVASPWMDAPGPSTPAGSFRAPGAASATTMWSPSDERGRPTSPPRAGAAAPPSGNVFTHEEKHAQAVRAGEARRASSSTARETILDAVRQMMERRALERERDGRDPPPVDDDDDDDDIVKLRTSRGSLFSVEQIREWRRRAIAAQVAIRWRRKQRRESTWSFAVEDGVRHVLGMGPAPDPDTYDAGGGPPLRAPPSDEGYTRRRSGYAPHVLARGGAVAWFPKRRNDEEDEKGRAVGWGDAREAWETAADEREQPARATLERKKRLPYVTARRPADDESPDESAPETASERARRVESEKEQKRRAAADERARSATFVARAVSVVSAFSPFKKAASSVGAYKESAEDVAQLEELSREEEGARIMRAIHPGRNGVLGALADQRRREREANVPLAMKLAGAAAAQREREDAARKARDAADGKVTAAQRVFQTTRGWRFSKEEIDAWRNAAAAADVRMRWKRRKRRETTFAWRLEEAARAMLAMGPNVEDMRVARVPGRTRSANVVVSGASSGNGDSSSSEASRRSYDAAKYEHVSDASLSRGAFTAAPLAHKLPRVDVLKVAAPAELTREERARIIEGETRGLTARTREIQMNGDFKTASKWRVVLKAAADARDVDVPMDDHDASRPAVTKGGVYYARKDRDLPLATEPKDEDVVAPVVEKDDPYSLEGRRCTCDDTDAVVSGPGRDARTLAKTVRRCPVHFPFGWHSEHRPPPRPIPSKTHGVTSDRNTSVGLVTAAGGTDAGYVMYQTRSHFYLASHDYSGTRWRLAKIERRADSLNVVEDENEYDARGVKALISAVHRGNEHAGGCEAVARGSGVVAFLQLSATREDDDPAGAAATSTAAAIARAEALHADRVLRARKNHAPGDDGRPLDPTLDRWEERGDAPYAGGHVAATRMDACLVFSGCDAVTVNRRARTRSEALGAQVDGGALGAEVRRATRALMFEEPGGDGRAAPPLGHRVAPAESEFATLEPGETLRLGATHVVRLTVGHLTSTEPIRRLGIGRNKDTRRIGCGARKCAEGCRGSWSGIVSWGGDCGNCRSCVDAGAAAADDDDNDDAKEPPSLRELARLEKDATLETWFGRYVWRGMDDDSDEEDERHPSSSLIPADEGRRRGSDPTLIKLRFRRYQAHART